MKKFWKCGYHPNVVAKIEDVETILLMLSANMGGVDPTGIYDDSDADQRAAGSSSFWWTEDTIEIIAAWRPDADNPSLEKILCREAHLA